MQVNNIGNLLLENMEHKIEFKPKSLRDLQYLRSRTQGNKVLKGQLLERIVKGLQEESEEMEILYRRLLVTAVRYIKKYKD